MKTLLVLSLACQLALGANAASPPNPVEGLELRATILGGAAIALLVCLLYCGLKNHGPSLHQDWGYLGGSSRGFTVNGTGILFATFLALFAGYGFLEFEITELKKAITHRTENPSDKIEASTGASVPPCWSLLPTVIPCSAAPSPQKQQRPPASSTVTPTNQQRSVERPDSVPNPGTKSVASSQKPCASAM